MQDSAQSHSRNQSAFTHVTATTMLHIIASLLGHAADSLTLSHFPPSSVSDQEEPVLTEGRLWGNLYEVNCAIVPPFSCPNIAFSAQSTPNLDLWHAQLSHISLKSLCYLEHHNLVTGMELRGSGELSPCNGCAKGKHHQAPFLKFATSHATRTIE